MQLAAAIDLADGHRRRPRLLAAPGNWAARNTPMVDDPLNSTIVKLSRSAFAGKPFTVSEVNHPNPNEYASEMIPILAADGAFQDWDGIFFYTFEPKALNDFQPFVADNFDITLDPVKMIQMSVGDFLFSRPDVKPAREVVTRTTPPSRCIESMRLPESARPYFTPGFPVSTALRHAVRIESLDGPPTKLFPPTNPAVHAPTPASSPGTLQRTTNLQDRLVSSPSTPIAPKPSLVT